LRLCEAVRPERIDHPSEDLPGPRRAWRRVEEKEPPVVFERPAYASQFFRRGVVQKTLTLTAKTLSNRAVPGSKSATSTV